MMLIFKAHKSEGKKEKKKKKKEFRGYLSSSISG